MKDVLHQNDDATVDEIVQEIDGGRGQRDGNQRERAANDESAQVRKKAGHGAKRYALSGRFVHRRNSTKNGARVIRSSSSCRPPGSGSPSIFSSRSRSGSISASSTRNPR